MTSSQKKRNSPFSRRLRWQPFTDRGSVDEVFTDLTVWAGIKKAIERINANAIEAA